MSQSTEQSSASQPITEQPSASQPIAEPLSHRWLRENLDVNDFPQYSRWVLTVLKKIYHEDNWHIITRQHNADRVAAAGGSTKVDFLIGYVEIEQDPVPPESPVDGYLVVCAWIRVTLSPNLPFAVDLSELTQDIVNSPDYLITVPESLFIGLFRRDRFGFFEYYSALQYSSTRHPLYSSAPHFRGCIPPNERFYITYPNLTFALREAWYGSVDATESLSRDTVGRTRNPEMLSLREDTHRVAVGCLYNTSIHMSHVYTLLFLSKGRLPREIS